MLLITRVLHEIHIQTFTHVYTYTNAYVFSVISGTCESCNCSASSSLDASGMKKSADLTRAIARGDIHTMEYILAYRTAPKSEFAKITPVSIPVL